MISSPSSKPCPRRGRRGFDNLNLDLIYALPEQTLKSWQTTVKRVLELQPEHISAYALTLEHGTPFGKWADKGLLPLPDPDLAADMYEWTMEYLPQSGYAQYEISNWAIGQMDGRPQTRFELPSAFACRHNLQYWRSLPYLGLGAGAHGYANGYRYSNVLRIKTYIDRLTANSQPLKAAFPLTPATVNHHKQTQQDDISDYMINNLRLVDAGVAESDFRSRFGSGLLDVLSQGNRGTHPLGLLRKKDLRFLGGLQAYQTRFFCVFCSSRVLGNGYHYCGIDGPYAASSLTRGLIVYWLDILLL
jgi:oxygen-independent coproporphyrinogen III oxidase